MSAKAIEERLAAARRRVDRAAEDPRRWQADGVAEWWDAWEAVLQLERELGAAKGDEHAVPMDFPLKWHGYSPRPHLLCNDHRALLTFVLREEEPSRDGSNVEGIGLIEEEPRSLALVEFAPYQAARLGSPNDEVFDGHPLHGHGADHNTAQEVINSRWLAEVEAINKVHHGYDPATWRSLNHYIFWFKDSTFECLAGSYAVEIHRESMAEMLMKMCRRLGS